MINIENSVRVSWQLVSQFVSWEFCRYMCEQNEKEHHKAEYDVLTFLRNMIVERTEKAASDITKHEIVAKFVMETRTIEKPSKMPCILALSETLAKVCPELQSAMNTLLPRLEGLLKVLEWNDDSENAQLLRSSVADTVNDFVKEACSVLPIPDLPQVVEPWLQHVSKNQGLKAKCKGMINVALYQKAVDCLRNEKITPTEAKIIAESLYEDKELETLFHNLSETETDAESQPQSQSLQSSQLNELPSSQQSLQLLGQVKPISLIPQLNLPDSVESLNLNSIPPERASLKTKLSAESTKQQPHENIPESTTANGRKPDCPSPQKFIEIPAWEPSESNSSTSEVLPVKTRTTCTGKKSNHQRYLDFIQCDDNSSEDEMVSFLQNKVIHELNKSKATSSVEDSAPSSFLNSQYNNSDSDTSDCDEVSQVRFLTPTIFKEGNLPQRPIAANVCPSDPDSNESAIISVDIDSQPDDPTFQVKASAIPVKKRSKPVSKRSKKAQLQKNKNPKILKQNPKIQKENPVIPKQTTLRGFGFCSDVTDSEVTPIQRPPPGPKGTARKRRFKLFDNDLFPGPLNDSVLFQKKKGKKKATPKSQCKDLGCKRKCDQCKKTFRTPLDLKKHIFIQHTVENLSE